MLRRLLLEDELAASFNYKMKVSRVKVSWKEPELPLGVGIADAVALATALTAEADRRAADVALADVAALAEVAARALGLLSDPEGEPEDEAPDQRVGPRILYEARPWP
jgi:hypothetical protein